MKPRTPAEYFEKTEHAVRHFYEGIASCRSYAERAYEHWDLSKLNQPLTPENKLGLDEYLKLMGNYFDLKFSEGTFSGAILQVAYMGIRYFSRNKDIPRSCFHIVLPETKSVIPFCIGREVCGLPLGLIIYAARNQYNHWDEEPHPITRKVFFSLSEAFSENSVYDLAFEIPNLTITIHANEVLLGALGWSTYERYVSEMKGLLCASL
jgi:hypothetical protein